MADDTNTAEREAFEAHCLRTGHSSTSLGKWGEKDDVPTSMRGDYIMRNIQNAWLAFQAGRASLAASAGSEPVESDGWLHQDGLLYRLTDERRPCNRDEINVTMADGSRSIESRSRRALELLDRIRATHPSPPEGMAGWISVDERLPELYKRVLVITTDAEDDPYATPAHYNGLGKFLAAGGHRLDPVTHWQEIEAPPVGWKLPPAKPRVSNRRKGRPPLPASAKEL